MIDALFKQIIVANLLLLITHNSYALSWRQLWATPNQQAAQLMQQSDFVGAQALFDDKAWRASAAFRAKNYQQAASDFESLHSEEGYYNQGNALAHLGQYEQAIKAYDKALAINPQHEEARYNRELVLSLLNSQQDKQQQQQQNNASKQDKDQPQQEANQNNSSSASKPDKTNSDSQQQQQTNQKPQDPSEKPAKPVSKSLTDKNSTKTGEQKQANEQWLRLIPDDPGGLLREKFLRDYIRRQHGWH